MTHKLTSHLRHHLLAYLALFIALGGTSYAAARLPANSVGASHLQDGAAMNDVFKQPGNIPELGSGKTLRGNFSAAGPSTGGKDYASDSISFVFTLKSAPTSHYIKQGQSPPTECPGSASFPKAKSGHLCVYEGSSLQTPAQSKGVGDPVTDTFAKANRFGATVNVTADDTNLISISGTWAVTSP